MSAHGGFRVTKKRFVFVVLCFVLVVWFSFLSGCEKGADKMADPGPALKHQAEVYWKKRLLEKDYRAIFEMEAQKDRLPFVEYERRVNNAGQLIYLGIDVKKVEVNGKEGEVNVKVKLMLPGLNEPVELGLPPDRWVIEKNQWKHLLKKESNMLTKGK
ncbi:conserved hypothetical protein [delta proteobacterium NaphS2]|nr:conserved hypothetical protein [delta proteobacterium NaphS2]